MRIYALAAARCAGRNFQRASGAGKRRGAAAVFGLFLILSLIVLTAVTMDLGAIRVAQTELRRSADAAAMAACWEMYEHQQTGVTSPISLQVAAWEAANEISDHNVVGQSAPHLNFLDIEVGEFDGRSGEFHTALSNHNAVSVTVRRHPWANGELPLFFGSITGRDSQKLQMSATAAMFAAISGFTEPESDETLNILPFALDLPSWEATVAGLTDDDYAYQNGNLQNGSDGVSETNLYPKGNGSPGNRGTVDIGGDNNSTNDLSRQILNGIARQDLIDLGKPLEFDTNGELELNGDTGISAGVKDELATLIGKTRMIPIFTMVQGNGNNAVYTIVRFEGVRILAVKLTGPARNKHVMIQPAKLVARNTVVDYSGTVTPSSHLVTPVMLVE